MQNNYAEQTSCLKEFARYTSLNVLGMIGLSCYILADTFFVAKGLGTSGLAALNLAIPVYSFIHGSGLMFGIGGATKFSISRKSGLSDLIFTNTLFFRRNYGPFVLPGRTVPVPADYSAFGR